MIEVVGGSMMVSGPMTIPGAATLKDEGASALDGEVTVIDLSAVTDADSSAVAVLLAWVRAAQEKGRTVAISHAPESIRSLAALYGVADLLPLA